MLQVLALAPWLGSMSVLLAEGPPILVEPPELTGRAVENRELIAGEIDKAVAAHGTKIATQPGCDAACVAAQAQSSKAQFRVRVRVQEEDRDYTIALELLDAAGTSVARSDTSCDICAENEAAAQTGRDLDALLAANVRPPTSVRITTAPSGANVVFDGSALGTTPIETPVEPGRHEVTLEREGYQPASREFTAQDGKTSELHVELVKGGEAPPPLRKSVRKGAWIGGWVAIGVGVALLSTGIALLAIDEREIKNDCSGSNVDAFGNCRYRYNTFGGGAAATAIGLAAAGTGIGLVIWSRPRKGEPELRANLGPTRVGLTLRF